MALKDELIKLGYERPFLRDDLRPILASLEASSQSRTAAGVDYSLIDELEDARQRFAKALKQRSPSNHVIATRGGKADVFSMQGDHAWYEFDVVVGHGESFPPKKAKLSVEVQVRGGVVSGGRVSLQNREFKFGDDHLRGSSVDEVVDDALRKAPKMVTDFVERVDEGRSASFDSQIYTGPLNDDMVKSLEAAGVDRNILELMQERINSRKTNG